MSHTSLRSLRFLSLSVLVFFAPRLDAADEIRIQWNELCKTAEGHTLVLQTAGGATVEGACLRINVDEVSINWTDNQVVKIARNTLARIAIRRSKDDGHQLMALGRGVHKSLRQGVHWLFSKYAPAGMVTIPAALAWGAVSAPFCAIGDLVHQSGTETREIKII